MSIIKHFVRKKEKIIQLIESSYLPSLQQKKYIQIVLSRCDYLQCQD
jgi:hypothetical protein